jgi:hypothetical protein
MTKCILNSPKRHNRGKTQCTIKSFILQSSHIMILNSTKFGGSWSGETPIYPPKLCLRGVYIKLVRILKQNFNQLVRHTKNRRLVRVMVFHATFNNISVISWRSFLLVEETGLSGENRRPAASN